MKIYQGNYLNISFEIENNRFVQFWISSPECLNEFKKEMLMYTKLYKKYRPEQSLWLQQNFSLTLDQEAHEWIEEKVNIPCKEYGNEKLAFVVSEDVLAHVTVINSFKETNSCIFPKHFSTEEKARNWLNDVETHTGNTNKTKIMFEGTDEEGNSIFKFKSSESDITKTIISFKNIIDTNKFRKDNVHKYTTLTKREREILYKYSKGHNINSIAKELFISLHTARTHWKNIKRKLKLSCSEEILIFSKVFDPRKYIN